MRKETVGRGPRLGRPRLPARLATAVWNRPAINRLSAELSWYELRRRMRRESGLDDVLETAYRYRGLGCFRSITPIQHPAELRDLARLVESAEPTTAVEIGTDRGGTLYVWSRWLSNLDRLVSVDLDYATLSHGRLDRYENRSTLYERFGEHVSLVEGDSRSEGVRDAVEREVGGEIDFLFVDGDHSYEGVKRDFEAYEPLVADGGLVAFHDIVDRESLGIPTFWREIEASYDATEIVHASDFEPVPGIGPDRRDRLVEYAGIGVLQT